MYHLLSPAEKRSRRLHLVLIQLISLGVIVLGWQWQSVWTPAIWVFAGCDLFFNLKYYFISLYTFDPRNFSGTTNINDLARWVATQYFQRGSYLVMLSPIYRFQEFRDKVINALASEYRKGVRVAYISIYYSWMSWFIRGGHKLVSVHNHHLPATITKPLETFDRIALLLAVVYFPAGNRWLQFWPQLDFFTTLAFTLIAALPVVIYRLIRLYLVKRSNGRVAVSGLFEETVIGPITEECSNGWAMTVIIFLIATRLGYSEHTSLAISVSGAALVFSLRHTVHPVEFLLLTLWHSYLSLIRILLGVPAAIIVHSCHNGLLYVWVVVEAVLKRRSH